MTAVVTLSDADAACGVKASTLGRLRRAGLTVPDGVVVPQPRMPRWQRPLLRAVGEGPFAVRSSARHEDGPAASFAGQLLTLLDVERDDVVTAVRAVERSARRASVRGYAVGRGLPAPEGCAVLVQELVRPRAAGVLFARAPASPAVVLECVLGSGRPVVDGAATPERWIVDDAPRRVQTTATGEVLSAEEVRQVVTMATQVVAVLGDGQDIEWAFVDDAVAVLQSRPITAHSGPSSHEPTSSAAQGELIGTGASPGVASGPVRHVACLDDLPHVAPGDVLVCRTTSPAWTPAMLRSAAVVTETGGVLSHAAIVAREFGIPAVVGLPDAMRLLVGGTTVRVDGSTGVVTPSDGAAVAP